MTKSGKRKKYILLLLLCGIAFGVYLNSLHGEFLIDDQTGILNNPNIHDIKTYFSKHFSLRQGEFWNLARVFIWPVSGGKPYFFHLFNVLTHASCAALLFILLNNLFNNINLSFLASLIFAVHPIHTEAVSWISGGSYALSSLFFIAAMIFYIKSDKSITSLALSIIFFSLCLLTGNTVATLPLMFIIYDLFFRQKTKEESIFLRRFRLTVLFPILLISAFFVGIIFISRNKFMHTIFYFKGPSYLVVIAKALVYYLKIIYLPLARGLYHPFAYNTANTHKISPAFFISLVVIFVSIFLFFRCRRNAKPLSFGIAWFFVTYLPYSNIIPVCNIVSERYMYLPTVGISIILAYLFLKVWEIINKNTRYRKFLRITAMVAVVLFLLSYAILTVKRNREYNDIITYWQTNINNFPDGYMAYNNLAGTFYVMGEREQAIAYCWVTLMINPQQPHVWCNLGKVYREKGDLRMSKFCYEEALKVDKGYLPAVQALKDLEMELKKKNTKLK